MLILIIIAIAFFLSCILFFVGFLVCTKVFLQFHARPSCPAHNFLVGKVIVITGANKGMGFWTAMEMATRGSRVFIACKNKTKGTEAAEKIKVATGNKNVFPLVLNLSSFKSIRTFASELKKSTTRLDVLVNNAGVIKPNGVTEDGFHPTLQINALGPFLLTILLIDLLKNTTDSRIVNVTTTEGSEHYDILEDLVDKGNGWFAYVRNYENSKKCLGLLMTALSEKLVASKANISILFSLPRPCKTDLQVYENLPEALKFIKRRILTPFLCIEPEESAINTIFTSLSNDLRGKTCKYYRDCDEWDPGHEDTELDIYLRRKIWWKCIEYVKLKPSELNFPIS